MEPEPTLSVRAPPSPAPAPPSYFWRRLAIAFLLLAAALVAGLCFGLLPLPGAFAGAGRGTNAGNGTSTSAGAGTSTGAGNGTSSGAGNGTSTGAGAGGPPSLPGPAVTPSRLYSIVLSVPVTAMTTSLGISLRCDVAAAAPGANATLLGFLQTNAQQVAVGLNDPINRGLCGGGVRRRRSLGSEPQCASMGSTRGISTVNITLLQPVSASLAATLANLTASFGFVQTSAAVLADACLVPAGMSAAALLPTVLSAVLTSELLPPPSADQASAPQPSVTATRTSLTTLSGTPAPSALVTSGATPSGSVAPSTSSTTTISPSASSARSTAPTPTTSVTASITATPSSTPPAVAPVIALVKDVVSGTGGSYPSYLTALPDGSGFIFQATTTAEGAELWVSTGTTAGSALFLDMNPGTASSSPDNFVVMGGVLYFAATAGTVGKELYSCTGTAASVALVKDINPGSSGSSPNVIRLVNGKLYFVATDGVNGAELWESDGTSAGTLMLKNIHPTGASYPSEFKAFNGKMFFQADDSVNGNELWSSDYTAAGTSLFKDLNTGSSGSSPRSMVVFNTKMYFQATDATNGAEMWVSDSTVAGTVLLVDIYPGTSGSSPTGFIEFNNKLFFGASNGFAGNNELYASDGTAAGTALVKEISLDTALYSGSYPQNFIVYKGVLYFQATDGSTNHGSEQWKTDGSAAGTVLVNDLKVGGEGYFKQQVILNGVLYFQGSTAATGVELYSFTA